jgi:hypothetical protein
MFSNINTQFEDLIIIAMIVMMSSAFLGIALA